MPVSALEIISISTKANITDVIGGKEITFVVTESSLLSSVFGDQNAEEKQINCDVSYEIIGAINKTGVISTGEELVLDKEGSYEIQAQFTDLVLTTDKSYQYNNYAETITVEKLSAPEITYDGEYVSITSDEDADIYYSINETASEQSTLYDTVFTIQPDDETVTITAIAVKDGYVASDISKKDVIIEKEVDNDEIQCSICGEKISIKEVVYNDDLICQDCYNDLHAGEETEEMICPYCDENFNITEDVYDENGDIICPYCDKNLTQEKDEEEQYYIECPYCRENFEDSEDVYDEDGYAICPYCDEYIYDIEEIPEESEFTASEWAFDEVNEAYEAGLIPDEMKNYDLTDRITRAEFAAIAVKLYEGLTGNTIYGFGISDTPFKDCDEVGLYSDDITAAYLLGITTGTYENLFEPYAYIDREQLATMLCRAIKKAKFDDWSLFEDWKYSFDIDYVKMFADDEEISDYAKNSVYFMASYGIINGINETHFAPKNTTIEQERMGYASATCEQAILMSLRSYNQLFDTDIEFKQISYYDGFEHVISFGDFAGCEPYSYEFLYGANFCEIKYDASYIPDFVINDYAIALMNEGYYIDGSDYDNKGFRYWLRNYEDSTYNDLVLEFNWDKRLLTICITLENDKAVG